jgi:hypothetical protein
MLSHDQAFAIAKQKQSDLEADAAVQRLVKAPGNNVKHESKAGGGLLASGPRRWRLFGRVRPA